MSSFGARWVAFRLRRRCLWWKSPGNLFIPAARQPQRAAEKSQGYKQPAQDRVIVGELFHPVRHAEIDSRRRDARLDVGRPTAEHREGADAHGKHEARKAPGRLGCGAGRDGAEEIYHALDSGVLEGGANFWFGRCNHRIKGYQVLLIGRRAGSMRLERCSKRSPWRGSFPSS